MKRLGFITFMYFALAFFVPFTVLANDYDEGDLNHDGYVDVADVTLLINRILSGQWSNEPSTQTFTVNGVSFSMVYVEGGTFTMGATPEQGSYALSSEKPAHLVTLSSFSIGQTEVTQALWLAVMGSNPSFFKNDLARPVETVSWNDCQSFIAKLNEMTGKSFRLPTEAEWEFAARGGNYSHGYMYSGSDYYGDVAWINGSGNTNPVANKAPNELGIYDMSGNVYEFVQDWYGNYVGYTGYSQVDPTGPESGSTRVYRGGSWADIQTDCRVSSRFSTYLSKRSYEIGLRLAL